jgi:hypothetical protein
MERLVSDQQFAGSKLAVEATSEPVDLMLRAENHRTERPADSRLWHCFLT